MKKIKINKKIIALVLFIIVVSATNIHFAANFLENAKMLEYSDEYKKWLDLPKEEQEKLLEPRMFDVPEKNHEVKNPLRIMVRNSLNGIISNYDLRTYIPKNVKIRNQMQTNSCWAFATLASLESNLAMQDYYNGIADTIEYDFSERHIEYATSRNFLDAVNERGFNREVGSSGNWNFAETYLINKQGAISENEMFFENNEEKVNISEIQNKNVLTKIYDTKYFPNSNTESNKQQIKEHIKQYGSVYASIHGADSIAVGNSCYNNSTGAKYCTEGHPIDHAVSIIGWNDNYNKENFNEQNRPTQNGAWIAKNSWGEKIEYNLDEMKNIIFDTLTEAQKLQLGNDSSQITDEYAKDFFQNRGFEIENDKAVYKVGDNGIIYISYEDTNVYSAMYGIVKASTDLEEEKTYKYNDYEYSNGISIRISEVYLGNIFNKETAGTEYLKEVSLNVIEECNCTVYVNPNGTSMNKNDLQKIKLVDGDSKNLEAGYHTLEFSKFVPITGNSFAVVVKIQRPNSYNDSNILLEVKYDENNDSNKYEKCDDKKTPEAYKFVSVENEKCFITDLNGFENNNWSDLSKMQEINSSLINGDSTIRAVTTTNFIDNSLRNIEITVRPTKTTYFVGENFNKAGMVVTANYNNNTSKVIEDYEIINGTNLQLNQTSVRIQYEDAYADVEIQVEKKNDTEIEEESDVIQPKNSDFNNAEGNVTNLKLYTYTDNSKQEYALMELEINKILRNAENDEYKYYYFLSANPNESSIENWIEITEVQNYENKIKFKVDTRNFNNDKELFQADKLFIYIKEIVTKGGNQGKISSQSIELQLNGETEYYIDDVKIMKKDEKIEINNEDNTTAKGILPQTGKNIIMTICISIISAFGLRVFIKYKKINKYLK